MTKRPPTSFFPCNFYRRKNWPEETLVLTVLLHLPNISSSYLVLRRNYWTWTEATPQKKCFFWSSPYKIEIMITSLTEKLPNFGHMNTHTIWFELLDKILLVMPETKIITSSALFQNMFTLISPRVAIIADIIKIVTIS